MAAIPCLSRWLAAWRGRRRDADGPRAERRRACQRCRAPLDGATRMCGRCGTRVR